MGKLIISSIPDKVIWGNEDCLKVFVGNELVWPLNRKIILKLSLNDKVRLEINLGVTPGVFYTDYNIKVTTVRDGDNLKAYVSWINAEDPTYEWYACYYHDEIRKRGYYEYNMNKPLTINIADNVNCYMEVNIDSTLYDFALPTPYEFAETKTKGLVVNIDTGSEIIEEVFVGGRVFENNVGTKKMGGVGKGSYYFEDVTYKYVWFEDADNIVNVRFYFSFNRMNCDGRITECPDTMYLVDVPLKFFDNLDVILTIPFTRTPYNKLTIAFAPFEDPFITTFKLVKNITIDLETLGESLQFNVSTDGSVVMDVYKGGTMGYYFEFNRIGSDAYYGAYAYARHDPYSVVMDTTVANWNVNTGDLIPNRGFNRGNHYTNGGRFWINPRAVPVNGKITIQRLYMCDPKFVRIVVSIDDEYWYHYLQEDTPFNKNMIEGFYINSDPDGIYNSITHYDCKTCPGWQIDVTKSGTGQYVTMSNPNFADSEYQLYETNNLLPYGTGIYATSGIHVTLHSKEVNLVYVSKDVVAPGNNTLLMINGVPTVEFRLRRK